MDKPNPPVLRNIFAQAGLETDSTVFSREVQLPALKVIFEEGAKEGGG